MEKLLIDLMKEWYIRKMLSIYNNDIDIVSAYIYNGTDNRIYFNF
jgi:hypothetical protein